MSKFKPTYTFRRGTTSDTFVDTYELDLPHNLPPSYRGRTLKLSYEFIIGICRSSTSSSTGPGSSSRVMKVPIRIYNHVSRE